LDPAGTTASATATTGFFDESRAAEVRAAAVHALAVPSRQKLYVDASLVSKLKAIKAKMDAVKLPDLITPLAAVMGPLNSFIAFLRKITSVKLPDMPPMFDYLDKYLLTPLKSLMSKPMCIDFCGMYMSFDGERLPANDMPGMPAAGMIFKLIGFDPMSFLKEQLYKIPGVKAAMEAVEKIYKLGKTSLCDWIKLIIRKVAASGPCRACSGAAAAELAEHDRVAETVAEAIYANQSSHGPADVTAAGGSSGIEHAQRQFVALDVAEEAAAVYQEAAAAYLQAFGRQHGSSTADGGNVTDGGNVKQAASDEGAETEGSDAAVDDEVPAVPLYDQVQALLATARENLALYRKLSGRSTSTSVPAPLDAAQEATRASHEVTSPRAHADRRLTAASELEASAKEVAEAEVAEVAADHREADEAEKAEKAEASPADDSELLDEIDTDGSLVDESVHEMGRRRRGGIFRHRHHIHIPHRHHIHMPHRHHLHVPHRHHIHIPHRHHLHIPHIHVPETAAMRKIREAAEAAAKAAKAAAEKAAKLVGDCAKDPVKCAKDIGCAACTAVQKISSTFDRLTKEGAAMHPCFTINDVVNNGIVKAISGLMDKAGDLLMTALKDVCKKSFGVLFAPMAKQLGLSANAFCEFDVAISNALSKAVDKVMSSVTQILPDFELPIPSLPDFGAAFDVLDQITELFPSFPGINPLACMGASGGELSDCIGSLFDNLLSDSAVDAIARPKWNTIGLGGEYLNYYFPKNVTAKAQLRAEMGAALSAKLAGVRGVLQPAA